MSLNNVLYVVLILLFGFGFSKATESEEKKFAKIVKKAEKENWNNLPFGDIVVKVGTELIGVPYVGGTLDNDKVESCTIELNKLDCVTFFEVSLAIADVLTTEDNPKFNDLYDRIEYTRYRDGVIDGYESRLHYTSDWILDNIEKGVVEDITEDLNGVPLKLKVYFMSKNSDKYPKLKNNKQLIDKIRQIEADINKNSLFYIPKDNVHDILEDLENGDIIGFVTSIDGLDYGHIGIVNKEDGTSRLMHASTTAKKVVLDTTIDEYIDGVSKFVGITVLRPIAPTK
ncbi:MAG: DUF1460 domain-containing protein [Candidatus Kapaibacterium sp.]